MRPSIAALTLIIGLALAAGVRGGLAAPAAGQAAEAFPSAYDPAWSPDGRRIAYVTDGDGDYEIAVMNADGSRRRTITRNRAVDMSPDWTPDGRIVFASDRDGDSEIYSMRADGTEVRQLTDNDAGDRMPDVSPDGARVVFSTDRLGEGCQIFVMAIDGTDQHAVVADEEDDHVPAWSPDGRRIAFEGGADESYIDVVNADGTGRVRLTSDGEESDPAWTLDGRIVFSSYENGLMVMNTDGSGLTTIAATRGDESRPVVSPDGRRLAFDSDAEGYNQVFVSLLDGTQARRLTGPPRAFTSGGDRCSIVGTPRADVLSGTSGDDVICGLGGDDRITGLAGADVVDGGLGRDRLEGGPGDDRLLGGAADDRLVGGPGDDRLDGGAGSDVLVARDGRRDFVDGGAGRDTAMVDPGDWVSFVERTG